MSVQQSDKVQRKVPRRCSPPCEGCRRGSSSQAAPPRTDGRSPFTAWVQKPKEKKCWTCLKPWHGSDHVCVFPTCGEPATIRFLPIQECPDCHQPTFGSNNGPLCNCMRGPDGKVIHLEAP